MSSSTYSTELTPEPRLQRIVMLAGCLALVLGQVTIVTIEVGSAWRVAAAMLWSFVSIRELYVIANGRRQCARIRVSCDGDIELLNAEGDWRTAMLASGSIVTSGLAWLRIKAYDGQIMAVLLRGKANECKQWRRLQVIWRHLGATH